MACSLLEIARIQWGFFPKIEFTASLYTVLARYEIEKTAANTSFPVF